MKTCTRCQEEKPKTDYRGKSTICKPCTEDSAIRKKLNTKVEVCPNGHRHIKVKGECLPCIHNKKIQDVEEKGFIKVRTIAL